MIVTDVIVIMKILTVEAVILNEWVEHKHILDKYSG